MIKNKGSDQGWKEHKDKGWIDERWAMTKGKSKEEERGELHVRTNTIVTERSE